MSRKQTELRAEKCSPILVMTATFGGWKQNIYLTLPTSQQYIKILNLVHFLAEILNFCGFFLSIISVKHSKKPSPAI
jgi:hypothetical protein